MDYLKGKKTYIVGAAGLLVCAAWMLGWIDDDTANKACVMLGFGGAMTFRHGLSTGA